MLYSLTIALRLGLKRGNVAALAVLAAAGLARANVLHVSPLGDDTTAVANDPSRPFQTIQAALAVLQNGDTVRIAAGRYEVTPGFPSYQYGPSLAPLQLLRKSNVRLAGVEGETEIFGAGPGDFLTINKGTNIVVEGIAFRGTRPEVKAEPGQLYSMIMLRDYNQNLLFRRCRFVDFGNHGISHLHDPKNSRDVTVSECTFLNGGDADLDGQGEDGAAVSGIGAGWVVTSNLVANCVRGFEIEGCCGSRLTNIIIQANLLTNTSNLGIMLFVTDGGWTNFSDILIADNRIVDTRRDTPGWANGMLITGGQRLVIRGNLIERTDHVGIACNASFGSLRECVIEQNHVLEAGLRGIQTIEWPPYRAENLVLRQNVVTRSGDAGIRVLASQARIDANYCRNNGRHSENAGIRVMSGSGSVFIQNNSTGNDDEVDAQDYGVWIQEGVQSAVLGYNSYLRNSVAHLRVDDPTSVHRIVIDRIDPPGASGMVSLKGRGLPDTIHSVYGSLDLQWWALLGKVTADSQGYFQFAGRVAGATGKRFYRVSAPEPAPAWAETP